MPRKIIKARPSGSQSHTGTGQLRVIAGEWCSRKLPVADAPGLRPTSDRVRETVFNWLSMITPGAKVLDVFSGTGALSLEALSRGAASATILEKSPVAANMLKRNLATLKTSKAQVIETDSLIWLTRPADQPYDLIFLDPPFRMDMLQPACELLERNGYLHENCYLYIEVEKELNPMPVPDNWQQEKVKTTGQLTFSLWSRAANG